MRPTHFHAHWSISRAVYTLMHLERLLRPYSMVTAYVLFALSGIDSELKLIVSQFETTATDFWLTVNDSSH
jgi:hypothetical protein